MALHPQPLPQVPDATAAAVRAAFPKGNLYVDLRAEFGTLYDEQLFADLYPNPLSPPSSCAPDRRREACGAARLRKPKTSPLKGQGAHIVS
jgi:transposase